MNKEELILYVFDGYKNEKIVNKIKRILRNKRHLRTSKKLGLTQLSYNCKHCKGKVDVHSTHEWGAYQWGKLDPVGLCEGCIREGKEPNEVLLPIGIIG